MLNVHFSTVIGYRAVAIVHGVVSNEVNGLCVKINGFTVTTHDQK